MHDETEAKSNDKAMRDIRWHRKKLFIVHLPHKLISYQLFKKGVEEQVTILVRCAEMATHR